MTEFPNRRMVLGSIAAGVGGLAGCLNEQGDSAAQVTNRTAHSTSDEPELSVPTGDGQLDGFDAFPTDWEVLRGSAQSDTETTYHGDQSVFLDSDGSPRIHLRREFDSPVDLAGLDFSIAVWIQDTNRAGISPRLVLRDDDGNTRSLSGFFTGVATERWHRLDMGLAGDEQADMSAIREIDISQYVGENRHARFYVDDIQTRPKPDRGYIIFSFDDGSEYDYTLAYPALEAHGYAGACFPTLGALRRDSSPTVEEYLEMQDDGWDIGGHTVNHERLTDHSRETQREILEQTRNELREYGFEEGSRHFRTTYSAYDTHTLDLMSELFELSIIGQGSATGTSLHITDPVTVAFNSGDDFERTKELIDIAVEYNLLLGLTFHMGSDVDADAFREVVRHASEYENQDELAVITPSELIDEYAQP